MKKILLFAFAILSFSFTSCKKPVSQMHTIMVKNGLGEECMVECLFCDFFDGWLEQDEMVDFVNDAMYLAKRSCRQSGSFEPKKISILSVDSVVTDNGKLLFICPAYINFIASNAYGVKDMIGDYYYYYFFKTDYDFMKYRDQYDVDGSSTLFEVCSGELYHEKTKYKTLSNYIVLDSFIYGETEYIVYTLE